MSWVAVWAGVLALGGCGAILRTTIGGAIDRRTDTRFPLGTFCVNLSGAFTVGVLFGAGVANDGLLLAGTALVGAYTTFSTWISDVETLQSSKHVEMALLDLFGSLLLGFGAALLGKLIGEAIF